MVARTGKARVAAVIGNPIAHSLSPALHEFWLSKYNIDGAYIPLDVSAEDFPEITKLFHKFGFIGANITLPHKEAAYKIVDEVDKAASIIGAVNTIIVREDRSLLGRNTDAFGFIENIRQHAQNVEFSEMRNILILGAGGAAKAISVGLIEAGASTITICNRTRNKAEQLKNILRNNYKNTDIAVIDWSDRSKYCDDNIDMLVNTTQLGMKGQEELEITIDNMNQNAIITDIVYNPLKTNLLKQAEKLGLHNIDGIGMLLWQAAAGFEAWFGKRPEVTDELREYILSYL